MEWIIEFMLFILSYSFLLRLRDLLWLRLTSGLTSSAVIVLTYLVMAAGMLVVLLLSIIYISKPESSVSLLVTIALFLLSIFLLNIRDSQVSK